MTTGKIKFDPYATGHPLNEGTSYIPVNFQKRNGQPGGKLKPHDTRSTRLQELSLMNNTYFGNIHYDIHLDMKIDYTIFQEMSLSELETLHQLCELERTQILQSLALAVLKLPYAGYLLSGNRSNFLDYEGNILCFLIRVPKKYHHYMFLKINAAIKESLYFIKIRYILLTHFQDEHIFGIPQSYVDQKIATM